MTRTRVLLAEDNAMISSLLSEMLHEMGYDVCAVAASEHETIAAAGEHKPDLMIVDARLGEGCGVAAVRTILRNGPVRHLFISGAYVEVDHRATIVLRKPFNESSLARAIARTIGDDADDINR